MAKPEIIGKLDEFLRMRMPFSEECHVIYLFVEIRKVLDHEQPRGKYPILRFYCNWSVHTDKRSTGELKSIMADIYKEVVAHIKTGISPTAPMKIIGFMYMEDLQAEVKSFLAEHDLPSSLIEADNWLALVTLLVRVLADQPINNPTPEIKSFAFLPAADRCVRGGIVFTDPVEGLPSYNFGNAY